MREGALIQIVDDDEAMRGSLEFLLASAAFATEAYETAFDLLERLPSNPAPDCILTDIRMPGMSGIELLRRLKAQKSEVPIIVMTGHGDLLLAIQGMKAGAFDFLEKPFSDDQLLASIFSAVEHSRGVKVMDRQAEELAAAIASLSEPEYQVFDRLVYGSTDHAIASELEMPVRTVDIYRANVMTKLDAASLSDVIRAAFIVKNRSAGRVSSVRCCDGSD